MENVQHHFSRFKNFWGSNKLHIILVVLVVIIAAILRLYVFVSPMDTDAWTQLDHPDYNDEFLVASHLVTYGEFPINGPDGLFGTELVSPLYFYFLSSMLFIYPDIKFLSFVNVILQILTLLGVYALARILFGKRTGLIALMLFTFANGVVFQSHMIWQPYVMQPFAILSYLLLVLGYKRKNKNLVGWSIVAFFVSMAFHYSMMVIAPVYFMLVVLTLRSMSVRIKDYIYSGIIAFSTVVALYLPSIIFMLSQENKTLFSTFSEISNFLEKSLINIGLNTIDWTYTLFNFFLDAKYGALNPASSAAPLVHMALLVTLLGATAYFVKAKRGAGYSYMKILGISMAAFLLSAAFISSKLPFYDWYLTPIIGLFAIFIAEIVSRIDGRNMFFALARVGVTTSLVYLVWVSGNIWIIDLKNVSLTNFITRASTMFIPEDGVKNVDPMVRAVAAEVRTLAEEKDDLYFFDFRMYWGFHEFQEYGTGIFWVPLENEFNTKLVKISGTAEAGYSPIAENPQYIFMVCSYGWKNWNEDECLNLFSEKYPEYSIEKTVYFYEDEERPFLNRSVYLARRKSAE